MTFKSSSLSFTVLQRFLTSSTGQNITPLPAGGAWPPHAVVLARGLASATVRAGHLPRLETVSSAGGGALSPRSDAPVKSAALCGAVLQRAGPANTHVRHQCQDYVNSHFARIVMSCLPVESAAHPVRHFSTICYLAVDMAVLCGQTGTDTLTMTL